MDASLYIGLWVDTQGTRGSGRKACRAAIADKVALVEELYERMLAVALDRTRVTYSCRRILVFCMWRGRIAG
jgi:hypothetical protein